MRATEALIEAFTFKVKTEPLVFGDVCVFGVECEMEGITQLDVSHLYLFLGR